MITKRNGVAGDEISVPRLVFSLVVLAAGALAFLGRPASEAVPGESGSPIVHR